MLIVYSRNGVPIRLTEERWQHIARRHPEMGTQRERVVETVEKPDMIQQGDRGELLAIRRYRETPLTEKYLVVPYREISRDDGFILTAYLASQLRTGRRIVWSRFGS